MSLITERRLELAGLETRALELDPPGRGRTGGGARRASSGAPALLLLHGWADSADTWRPLLARLAGQDRRAVALDLPGFGRAGRLDRDAPVLPQVDAFVAAAVEREADRAGGAGVIIAGTRWADARACARPSAMTCRSPGCCRSRPPGSRWPAGSR